MKNIIIKILITIVILLSIYKFYLCIENNYSKYIKYKDYINNKVNDDIYGYIKIDKINLLERLYNLNSINNSLDKGLFILDTKPIIILGHSGHGDLAIFNDLDKLLIGDKIIIKKNEIEDEYVVKHIMLKNKIDKIDDELDLTLVTCDKKDITKKIEILAKKIVK